MTPPIPFKTWVAVCGASLASFMAIVNIQVVGASMHDIEGAIGAGDDDGPWITTAYLIAEIVSIPLTGWLGRVFSTRRYLIGGATLFLLFSVACAGARSLEQMIVLRALQGFFGGVLIPVSFTLVVARLPPARLPVGMAIYSFAIVLGPVVGPTVGGMLTEAWGWQSVFYLNLVPGSVMLLMLWLSLEREPMQLGLLGQGDWAGIVTVMIGLGAAQTVLEEGQKNDWLESTFIFRLAIVAVVALGLFVWIEFTTARPLVNLRLLGRRNFLGGALVSFLMGIVSYGTVFVLPLYLSDLQGYNAAQIGEVMLWTGLPQVAVIPLTPWLMHRFDARLLVAAGLALFAASNFMNVGLSIDVSGDQLVVSNVVRAVGQAIVMAPLSTLAMAGIEKDNTASASALLNVLRNLGGAIGIALLQTVLICRQHFHWTMLASSVSILDAPALRRLAELQRYFQEHGVIDPWTALRKGIAAIGSLVQQQASVMAFGDVFYLLGVAVLLAILSLLLLRKPARLAGAHGADG
jgi:DHA2 family multidrug resistance protein